MKRVNVPGMGSAFAIGTDEEVAEHQRIIDARHEFVLKYMADKGWGDDVTALSIDQIMEIRSQPGWKKP